LKIGKKTFKETSIHKGAISISLAAVGLAVETYGSLQGKSVMVIGAGETAELTAEALINKRVGKITIANRTRLHAEQMLESLAKTYTFNGEVIDFASFKEHLPNTDIVISSTSSQEPVIFPDDIARRDKRILLIDIAVPRDVDPSVGNIANVVLKNIDDLHSIVDANYGRRMADLPRVKKLVVGEMADFLMWYYSLPLMPAAEKTGSKTSTAASREFLEIKRFLGQNVCEFHKLAMQSTGDARADLDNHVRLVDKLQALKKASFEGLTA
jgi:glutamyl-tRNA reductase